LVAPEAGRDPRRERTAPARNTRRSLHAAADAEVFRRKNAAAAKLLPYLDLSPAEQTADLESRCPASLDALISAVHRCIMEIGRKRRLVDFEKRVILAREFFEDELRKGQHW